MLKCDDLLFRFNGADVIQRGGCHHGYSRPGVMGALALGHSLGSRAIFTPGVQAVCMYHLFAACMFG